MAPRNYTNTSVETALVAGIDATQTSLTVADATGYPVAPFAIVADPDSVPSEEVMLVTAKAGPVWTVTRAYDGTTAKVHSAGATIIHAAIAADFTDLQAAAQPGGSDTQVQFNDAGAFGADAGLMYGNRELTIAGNTDKTTPLLTAHSGDFRASVVVVPGNPDSDILYTAVAVGPSGNAITIHYDTLAPDQVLTITVVGTDIAVLLATDSGFVVTSTANDVIGAVNGDVNASALVTATLAPGGDGTGLVSSISAQLAGGALASDTTWIDERGVLNVQLQTGVGLNAINVRDPNGAIVAHLDNDGGFAFASERFSVSQNGNMAVNTYEAALTGNTTLQYAINSFSMFTIAAGGGYGFSVASPVAGDIVFNVSAGSGQTGDLFVAFDENFVKTVRILPNGDLQMDKPGTGVILIDQDDGVTRWRLKVNSGVVSAELV